MNYIFLIILLCVLIYLNYFNIQEFEMLGGFFFKKAKKATTGHVVQSALNDVPLPLKSINTLSRRKNKMSAVKNTLRNKFKISPKRDVPDKPILNGGKHIDDGGPDNPNIMKVIMVPNTPKKPRFGVKSKVAIVSAVGIGGVATASGIHSAVTGDSWKDSIQKVTGKIRDNVLDPVFDVGIGIAKVGIGVGVDTTSGLFGGLFSKIFGFSGTGLVWGIVMVILIYVFIFVF